YVYDTLTYKWSAGGGSWKNGDTGQSVIWIAPPTPGSYTITCTISDAAEITPPATGNRNDADVQRSVTVKVIEVNIKQGTTDITDQTQDTIVGRNISLTGEVLPAGTTVTAHQWSVPGIRIENYSASADSATVNALEGAELQNSSVSYYWVDGGDGREVTYTATVGGTQCSGKTTFNVKRPTASVTSTTGTVGLYTGPVLGYGGPGISFSRTITEPTGFTGGSTQWVQVVSSTLRRRQDTSSVWWRLEGSNLVDTTYPYATSASTDDSPSTGLSTSYPTASVADYFYMYLEYIPSGGGIEVPLRRVYWYWNGYTHLDGSSWWLDSSGNNANPADADCTTLPEWSANVTSLSYQQEQ
ncbi:MAG: hypothetical protein M1133_11020, partial [Armatimonadetes bacterium]|nr:hypothetical protein [Armatimonadota bacterium]